MDTADNRTGTFLKWSFCAAVLALALYQFSESTSDPDLWAHTLAGEHMLRTGKLQNFEPYSWTAPGTPWINHELLAEMALGGAHWLLGGSGIMLLKVLVGFLTFGIALKLGFCESSQSSANWNDAHQEGEDGRARLLPSHSPFRSRLGGNLALPGFADDSGELEWPQRAVAWAVGGLAVVEISYGFAPRPQIFTALGLAIELALLRKIAGGHKWWCAALPILTALWVNTHGGVLAGLAIMFVTAASFTVQWMNPNVAKKLSSEPVPGQSVVGLWIACLASTASLLLNPYGWRLIEWTISGVLWLHERTELAEWRPTPPSLTHAALFVLLILAAVSFLLTRRNRALWEIAVTAGLAVFALRSVRHVPLFAITALAFVPPHLADVLVRFRGHYAKLDEMFRQRRAQMVTSIALALVAVAEFTAAFTLHKDHPFTMEVPRHQYPMAAVDFMRTHQLRGNLLVFFDWGEMCLWELPQCAVSIDGRWETCYPRDLIPEHWKFYNAEPTDKKILDISKADLALLPGNLAGTVALAHTPGWVVAYQDSLAAVLVRDASRFPMLLSARLPIEGSPKATTGRAAFPDSHAERLYQ